MLVLPECQKLGHGHGTNTGIERTPVKTWPMMSSYKSCILICSVIILLYMISSLNLVLYA